MSSIQKRDIDILLLLNETKYATYDQLVKLFFPSFQAARNRIKKLKDSDVLTFFTTAEGDVVYYPGLRGLSVLSEITGISRKVIKSRYGPLYGHLVYFSHTKRIIDLYVSLKMQESEGKYPIRLENFIFDKRFSWKVISSSDERKIEKFISPDGFLEIAYNPKEKVSPSFSFFFEIDLSTMEMKAFKKKIIKYIDFYNSKEWESYNYPKLEIFPSVLILCLSDKRLENLKDNIKSSILDKAAPKFKLSIYDEAINGFFDKIWYSPLGKDKDSPL